MPISVEELKRLSQEGKVERVNNEPPPAPFLERTLGEESPIGKTFDFAQEAFINPIGRAIMRGAAAPIQSARAAYGAGKAALTGGDFQDVKDAYMKPLNQEVPTPFGEVVANPAAPGQPSKVAEEVFDVATTIFPVGKLFKPIAKGIAYPFKRLSSKVPIEKIGAFLSNTKPGDLSFARENPELVKEMMQFADDETIKVKFGENIYNTAKAVKDKAIQMWDETKHKIITETKSSFHEGLKIFRQKVVNILGEEGISVTDEGLDLAGSTFEGDDAAQATLTKILNIMARPVDDVNQFLNKQTAISNIRTKISFDDKNLGRLVGDIVDSFDDMVDELTQGASTEMRKAYKAMVEPARKIMKQMTSKQGGATRVFDPDAARRFVNQLVSDVKFSAKELINKLETQLPADEAAEAMINQKAKAMGTARELGRLKPLMKGQRTYDIVAAWGITKLPVLAAFVSPRFWGEVMMKMGLDEQAVKQSVKGVEKVQSYFKRDFATILIQRTLIELLKGSDKE